MPQITLIVASLRVLVLVIALLKVSLRKVKKVVSDILQKHSASSSLEFVSEVALPLPNIILADLFSIPSEKRQDFYRWANHMTQFFGGGSENILTDAENADRGAYELREYFTELIHSRRKILRAISSVIFCKTKGAWTTVR